MRIILAGCIKNLEIQHRYPKMMVLKKIVSPAEKHGYFLGYSIYIEFQGGKKLQLRTNSLKGWKFTLST